MDADVPGSQVGGKKDCRDADGEEKRTAGPAQRLADGAAKQGKERDCEGQAPKPRSDRTGIGEANEPRTDRERSVADEQRGEGEGMRRATPAGRCGMPNLCQIPRLLCRRLGENVR